MAAAYFKSAMVTGAGGPITLATGDATGGASACRDRVATTASKGTAMSMSNHLAELQIKLHQLREQRTGSARPGSPSVAAATA
jgi:hypothetical protein